MAAVRKVSVGWEEELLMNKGGYKVKFIGNTEHVFATVTDNTGKLLIDVTKDMGDNEKGFCIELVSQPYWLQNGDVDVSVEQIQMKNARTWIHKEIKEAADKNDALKAKSNEDKTLRLEVKKPAHTIELVGKYSASGWQCTIGVPESSFYTDFVELVRLDEADRKSRPVVEMTKDTAGTAQEVLQSSKWGTLIMKDVMSYGFDELLQSLIEAIDGIELSLIEKNKALTNAVIGSSIIQTYVKTPIFKPEFVSDNSMYTVGATQIQRPAVKNSLGYLPRSNPCTLIPKIVMDIIKPIISDYFEKQRGVQEDFEKEENKLKAISYLHDKGGRADKVATVKNHLVKLLGENYEEVITGVVREVTEVSKETLSVDEFLVKANLAKFNNDLKSRGDTLKKKLNQQLEENRVLKSFVVIRSIVKEVLGGASLSKSNIEPEVGQNWFQENGFYYEDRHGMMIGQMDRVDNFFTDNQVGNAKPASIDISNGSNRRPTFGSLTEVSNAVHQLTDAVQELTDEVSDLRAEAQGGNSNARRNNYATRRASRKANLNRNFWV